MIRAVPIVLTLFLAFGFANIPSCAQTHITPRPQTQKVSEQLSKIFTCLDNAQDASQVLENAATSRYVRWEDPARFTHAIAVPLNRQTVMPQMQILEQGINQAQSTLAQLPPGNGTKTVAKLLHEMKASLTQAKYELSPMKFSADWITKPAPAHTTKGALAAYRESLNAEEEEFARESAQVGDLITDAKGNLAALSARSKIPYHRQGQAQVPNLSLKLASCVDMKDAQRALAILSNREEVKLLLASAKGSTVKKPIAIVLFQIGDEQGIQVFQTMEASRSVSLCGQKDKDFFSEYRVNIKTGACRYGLY